MTKALFDAVHGSLAAGCIADAIGAPTEELSRAQIHDAFGGEVTTFHPPLPGAPYAKGRHAAQITDDSSQMMMLTDLLVREGEKLTPTHIADMLVTWSKNPAYFPHFAGPTTRAAIDRLAQGEDPWIVGKDSKIMSVGASNGAAMRVAPVGLFYVGDVPAAARAAAITAVPSHNTSAGVAGAAAVAAATATAALPTATVLDVVRSAVDGAYLGEELGRVQGRDVPAPDVAERIRRAAQLAIASKNGDDAINRIVAEIGVGLPAVEAVPAAIGFLVAGMGDPNRTARLAANAGGDSDTIGCMAASIAGALSGIGAVDVDDLARVEEANNLDIAASARALADAASRRVGTV